MAADLEVTSATVLQDETTDEEFQDASTEYFEKSNNLGDRPPTEVGEREDAPVQAEPICKASSPRVSESAVEPDSEGDADTAEGVVLTSRQFQEDVVKEETDEVSVGDEEDTGDGVALQTLVEGRLEDAEEAVIGDVLSDSGEGGMGKNESAEQVAVDGKQNEGSDLDDSESADEELAYEAETDSVHSEEEEVEQSRSNEEEAEENRSEEEEPEENRSEEEEEGERNRSEEEEEGEQNRSEEEEEGGQNRSEEEHEGEGSGWEEPVEEGDVDASEKKTSQPKDPSLVPRDNRYFLHDTRDVEETSEEAATEQDMQPAEEEPVSAVDRVEKWEHDLFIPEQQAPRTEEEKQRDAWRSDDTQRGRGRGRGRGFRRGRGQRYSRDQRYPDQRYDAQEQRQGGRDQGLDGRDQRYDNRDQRRDGQDQRYDNRDERRDGQDQRYNRDQRRDGQDQRYNRDQRRDGQDQRYDNRYQRRDGRDQRYDSHDQGHSRHQGYDARDQRRDGRDQRYDSQDQRPAGLDQKHDGQHQRHDAQDQRRDRDQGYDKWEQRRDDRDQRRDSRDQRRDGRDRGHGQDQRYDGRGQRRDGQSQRYDNQDQRYARDERRTGRGQRQGRGGYAGSWDDGQNRTDQQQQQKRLEDEDHGFVVEAKEQQEHEGNDRKQDGRPSVGRGGVIKGGNFHRGGFAAPVATRGGRSRGGDKQEKENEGERGRELNEAAAMTGRGTEGAAVVGQGTDGAKDSPQSSKKSNNSSPPQADKGHKASPSSDTLEQQSEKPMSQNKGAQQKSLFGKGTGQEVKPGKERRPQRVYSLARGRPTSGGAVGSDVKPGSVKEEGSAEDTGKGHGRSSQPRSSKVPGSAVRVETSTETVSSAPPVEGDGEGEKGGGPKRYSVQRGTGEGGAAQKALQGYQVYFMVPGDQSAQAMPSSTSEPVPQGSSQVSSGGGNRPKTKAAKGQQKPLLATPAESAVYGIPFAPAPGPPGVGGPVLQYMPPVEGIPPFAMPMDPSIMMSLEGMGHYQGGLFIPHIPPEEQMQRMMMAPQGDSPQHVRPSVQQPKQRSRAIPIVPPKATSEGEQTLVPKGSAS